MAVQYPYGVDLPGDREARERARGARAAWAISQAMGEFGRHTISDDLTIVYSLAPRQVTPATGASIAHFVLSSMGRETSAIPRVHQNRIRQTMRAGGW